MPGLIQSSYVGGTGFATELYPGYTSPYWNGFGGKAVDLLQFTDAAQVAGHTVDANAFRGSLDDLRRLLGLTPPTTQGDLMALTDAQQTDLYQKIQDIWGQLLGPDGHGWPQLGQNPEGKNLTLVDAVAKVGGQILAAQPKAAP
ncbi:hypothetical protein [Nocardia yunnanensis]|uniref:hypothetical protein n=1 Tax=Nocardia yunnanensis TaxID=2382165 RepID=UPI001FE5D3A4|nr:hypothetical protein [Nocardia yunnanensis]